MPTIRKVTTEDAATWDEAPQTPSRWPDGKPLPATPEEIAQARTELSDTSGISRIDQESHHTHGWFARTYGSQSAAKLFSDMKYGGTCEALAAAVAWRDEQRKQHYSKQDQSQHTGGERSPTPNIHKVASKAVKARAQEEPERVTPEAIAEALNALADKTAIKRAPQPSLYAHGWIVRLYGPRSTFKMFSDRNYGGMQEALAAAVAWRDEQRKQKMTS